MQKSDDLKSRYQAQLDDEIVKEDIKVSVKSLNNSKASRSRRFFIILFIIFCIVAAPILLYIRSIEPDSPPDSCAAIEPSEKGEFSDEALQAIQQCPAQRIVELALEMQTASPGKALALLEYAAQQNYGPAARLIGEMYDPRFWAENKSPFKQPDIKNAMKWYNKAIALNDDTARERLQKLELERGS